jgi:hypothetical protein
LGRRLQLILIPVLLDLWLWLGPRLSVEPLFGAVARFYEGAADVEDLPADMAVMAEQVSQMLSSAGQNSNLMEALVSRSLLHVPSLLVMLGPIPGDWVYAIGNPLAAAGLFVGLSVVGLFVGVVYMNLLALRLPLGGGSKPATADELVHQVLRHWLMVMLFIVVLFVLLAVAALPVMMGSVLLSFVSPALSSILAFVYAGAMLVLFFYLYFVTAAIVLDNVPLQRAVAQSFLVVRNNFLATLLFILLTTVITVGFALIMRQLTEASSIGVAIAILVNAYIGSGITLALFIFYRTRILRFSTAQEDALAAGRMDGPA